MKLSKQREIANNILGAIINEAENTELFQDIAGLEVIDVILLGDSISIHFKDFRAELKISVKRKY